MRNNKVKMFTITYESIGFFSSRIITWDILAIDVNEAKCYAEMCARPNRKVIDVKEAKDAR